MRRVNALTKLAKLASADIFPELQFGIASWRTLSTSSSLKDVLAEKIPEQQVRVSQNFLRFSHMARELFVVFRAATEICYFTN